jgi:pimeloyl-ACP methyl ester carboxylesterase
VIETARREPDIAADNLARITAPTLLIGDDQDMVRTDHLLEIHQVIPGSQLCILPGQSLEITAEDPGARSNSLQGS